MKVGDIVYLGENMAWFVRKPLIDWRGHVEKADYNGYAKITEIRGDVVTVMGLYGSDTQEGRGWIAHPVRYRVTGETWECFGEVAPPADWDYEATVKFMTDSKIKGG